MKIEYLATGAPECPLLRIYNYDQHELQQLQANCLELSQGRLHKGLLAGPLQSSKADECTILGYIDDQDRGVVAAKVEHLFVLCLTNPSWLVVAEKLQPLLDDRTGFLWLSEHGQIKLLASYNGRW
jgi:hypothetical protein